MSGKMSAHPRRSWRGKRKSRRTKSSQMFSLVYFLFYIYMWRSILSNAPGLAAVINVDRWPLIVDVCQPVAIVTVDLVWCLPLRVCGVARASPVSPLSPTLTAYHLAWRPSAHLGHLTVSFLSSPSPSPSPSPKSASPRAFSPQPQSCLSPVMVEEDRSRCLAPSHVQVRLCPRKHPHKTNHEDCIWFGWKQKRQTEEMLSTT